MLSLTDFAPSVVFVKFFLFEFSANSQKKTTSSTAATTIIDIKNILLHDVRGKTITNSYHKNRRLPEDMQNLLIEIILDHIFNAANPSKVQTNEIEKLSNEICSIFPNEPKV